MLCNQCGQPLPQDTRFCPVCGTPVPIRRRRARLWPAFLTLLLIFSFGFGVFLASQRDKAADTITTSDKSTPWFTLKNGVLFFDQDRYSGSSELTVPQTIGGQTVTALSDECFAYCTDLVIVHLPQTLTAIGDSAFYGCTSRRGIRFPETLRSIGDNAFDGCISLEAVCIPYSLQRFGDDLFRNCHKLAYFFYPAPYAYWKALPIDDIPEDSFVYCADGIYPAK